MPVRRVSPRSAVRTVAALALSLAVATTGTAAPAPPASTPPDPAGGDLPATATVTLVTGDRVTVHGTVDGEPRVSVTDASGRHTGGYSVHQDEAGVHVVPHSVTALVPDVLDPELFNVSRLVELGYDDQSSDVLPLLVQAPGTGDVGTLAAGVLQVDLRLDSIDAVAGDLPKDEASNFLAQLGGSQRMGTLADADTRVWLDGVVEAAALDHYLDQVSAPAAWDLDLDGTGTTIAVLDTGVDAGHPDLAGQVVAQENFTDAPDADDRNGHGTHVASLAAGTGAGNDGLRQGIAPGADIVSGKVLNDQGEGQESWVIAGMEWAVAQGADVVNLSLSGKADGQNPLDVALEALAADSDALFVAAAGNAGGGTMGSYSIGTPGTSPSALTVGAVTDQDTGASFSSRGPTWGTYLVKPDLSAPGVELLGARAGARDGDLYTDMTGTSMASPVVAGAAALLRQQHPDWPAEEVKARLMSTSDGGQWFSAWTQGAGRLDLAAATTADLTTSRPNLDLGIVQWPHEGTVQDATTVTNTGSGEMTVEASALLETELKISAPEGAVSVSPASATIPAGGSVEFTVTIDRDLLWVAPWQGILSVGEPGGQGLRIPVGAYLEPESYQLELEVLDGNGDPWDPTAGAGQVGVDRTIPIFNGQTGGFIRLHPDAQGRVSARVPAGEWMVLARVYTPGADGEPGTVTVTGTAGLLVEEDTAYVLDAREGEPLEVPTVDGHATAPELAVPVIYSRTSSTRGYGEIVYYDPATVAEGRLRFTPTEPVQHGGFEALTRWWLEPTGPVRGQGADAYDVVSSRPILDAGLTPRVSADDLRKQPRLEQVFHPVGPVPLYTVVQLTGMGQLNGYFGLGSDVATPGTREVLVKGAEGAGWLDCLTSAANDSRQQCSDELTLRTGDRLTRPFGATMHPVARQAWHSEESVFVSVGVSDGLHRGTMGLNTVAQSRLELQTPDGATVGTADGTYAYFRGVEEAGRYRLVQELEMVPGGLSSMTGARTVWEFASAPPGEDDGFSTVPTFLDIDYGFDLGPGGTVGPGPLSMDLRVAPSTGQAPAQRIEELSVEVSADDGESWHVVQARRTGAASYRGMVNPSLFRWGSDHLSFRVSAVDAAGNSIEQTTHRLLEVG